MTHIIGEYPYYRADPADWRADLTRIRDEGITTVSFYLPWRLHECADRSLDFQGVSRPATNVTGLFATLSELGLRAVVKPGPFIHAEIRYGGLPDRIVNDGHGRVHAGHIVPGLATGFETATPVPPDDAVFLREAVIWLRAVRRQVIEPHIALIDSIQIGNEGVFSDAAKPTHAPYPALPNPVAHTLTAITDVFTGLQVPRFTNLPLPDPQVVPALSYRWWLTNVYPLRLVADTSGYTAWAGAPSSDRAALGRTIMATQLLDHGCVEENWGHVWDNDLYRRPSGPLQHSVLALALGSPTLSIYTAVSTSATSSDLEPTATGRLFEGLEPARYRGPYCPGAPLSPRGHDGPTLPGLQRLVAITDAISRKDPTRWEVHYDLDIVIDPRASAILWKAVELATDLLVDHGIHSRLTISESLDWRRLPMLTFRSEYPEDSADATLLTALRTDRSTALGLSLEDLTAASVADHIASAQARHSSLMRIVWTSRDDSDEHVEFLFNRGDTDIPVRRGTFDTVVSPRDLAVLRVHHGFVARLDQLETTAAIPSVAVRSV